MQKKSQSSEKRTFSTPQMALTAIMTAIMCILGPLSIPIPISPVPITLTNLVIYFTVCFLGWKLGTISYLLYLIIGLIGLPVFSAFGSGFGKLFGPTGGYLIGFIFMAIICGLFFEKYTNKAILFLGLILGSAVNYAFGTLWLAWQANLTFSQALWAGVIPYLPGDLIKVIFTIIFAPMIKKRIFSLHFYSNMI
ncbi:MAG: biotin transporter BioY [Eubacteriales bacterium]|nr:biotin transporter BioY [Eubacteriales bacterium]